MGGAAGRCSGVNGITSCGASTGVLAVTITALPVTHAIAPGPGVCPSLEHGVCWATARRLEMQNKAPNAMDLGPKFIIAFQGEPDSRCGESSQTRPRWRKGRKRWYYDHRYRSTLNHYPILIPSRAPRIPLTNTLTLS